MSFGAHITPVSVGSTYGLDFMGYIWGRPYGIPGIHMFNFYKYCQIISNVVCNNLPLLQTVQITSYLQCMRVPGAYYPHQYLILLKN